VRGNAGVLIGRWGPSTAWHWQCHPMPGAAGKGFQAERSKPIGIHGGQKATSRGGKRESSKSMEPGKSGCVPGSEQRAPSRISQFNENCALGLAYTV
jgi:hypothetical protein